MLLSQSAPLPAGLSLRRGEKSLRNVHKNDRLRGRSLLHGQHMGKTQVDRNSMEQCLAVGGWLVATGGWRLVAAAVGSWLYLNYPQNSEQFDFLDIRWKELRPLQMPSTCSTKDSPYLCRHPLKGNVKDLDLVNPALCPRLEALSRPQGGNNRAGQQAGQALSSRAGGLWAGQAGHVGAYNRKHTQAPYSFETQARPSASKNQTSGARGRKQNALRCELATQQTVPTGQPHRGWGRVVANQWFTSRVLPGYNVPA